MSKKAKNTGKLENYEVITETISLGHVLIHDSVECNLKHDKSTGHNNININSKEADFFMVSEETDHRLSKNIERVNKQEKHLHDTIKKFIHDLTELQSSNHKGTLNSMPFCIEFFNDDDNSVPLKLTTLHKIYTYLGHYLTCFYLPPFNQINIFRSLIKDIKSTNSDPFIFETLEIRIQQTKLALELCDLHNERVKQGVSLPGDQAIEPNVEGVSSDIDPKEKLILSLTAEELFKKAVQLGIPVLKANELIGELKSSSSINAKPVTQDRSRAGRKGFSEEKLIKRALQGGKENRKKREHARKRLRDLGYDTDKLPELNG